MAAVVWTTIQQVPVPPYTGEASKE